MKATADVRHMIQAIVRQTRNANPRLVLIPDPDEVLLVKCPACGGMRRRPARVIERENAKRGFWACSSRCTKVQQAKGERVLVPMRENHFNR